MNTGCKLSVLNDISDKNIIVIVQVADQAYNAASLLCDSEYFDHPQLISRAVDTTDQNIDTQGRVTAVYVPSHLHHILFEV